MSHCSGPSHSFIFHRSHLCPAVSSSELQVTRKRKHSWWKSLGKSSWRQQSCVSIFLVWLLHTWRAASRRHHCYFPWGASNHTSAPCNCASSTTASSGPSVVNWQGKRKLFWFQWGSGIVCFAPVWLDSAPWMVLAVILGDRPDSRL